MADLDGSVPIRRVLVSGQNSPVGMAVTSTHLGHWANLDGTGAAALFSDPGGPFGIAVGP